MCLYEVVQRVKKALKRQFTMTSEQNYNQC